MGTEREMLVKLLDELPPDQVTEVLDFAAFIRDRRGGMEGGKRRRFQSIPAAQLRPMLGRVAWGGDAVDDAERLYDNG